MIENETKEQSEQMEQKGTGFKCFIFHVEKCD